MRIDAWRASGVETRRRDDTAGPCGSDGAIAPSKRNRGKTRALQAHCSETKVYEPQHSRKAPVAQCINWVTDSGLSDAFGPRAECQLLRKEVIQPHLPVRLPCYDFTPIAGPTFDSSLLAVGPLASGVTDFHDLTGGVYKARERIHRSVADLRLLATPTS